MIRCRIHLSLKDWREKEARPFATELEKSLEMSSFQEGAY